MQTVKTNAEIRRENARQLAAEVGQPADLARRLGMSDSQMGQLIGRNPVRNIGPRIARRMEEVCGKPEGWLDVEHLEVEPGSLRDLQLQEARRILEGMSDADLSRALGWLQSQAGDTTPRETAPIRFTGGHVTQKRHASK
ncbi:hypothetical protein HTY52_22740 [Cupriavidus taiwanensis]|uniref:hypothetical protein n=1 Tax=Cupriavidus taiwanensis TaxID=164546 RepID=UPI0015721908|nr:hypothetical protein [Cupriavidus taiwanensis]NSX16913.1 hypothetical protein [Cupriavidus taiwanensis]